MFATPATSAIREAIPAGTQPGSAARSIDLPLSRFLLHLLPLLAVGFAAYWHGPYPIDDAYITFRYADNLAAGHGLVFNPGEPVLGTTTPLLAILLALLKLTGLSTPLAARALGWLGTLGVVFVSQRLAAMVLGEIAACAAALCLALHPDLAFTANSGMETGLSTLAVYATIWLTLRGRYVGAGLSCAIAILLRPDGAVAVLLPVGVLLWRNPRRAWQPIAAAAAVTMPWLAYATLTYGSFVPHSIAAKQLIHADSALSILWMNGERLTLGLEMKIVCGLAAVGLFALIRRRSEFLLLPAWMALYTAGLAASGIMAVFPWYVSPLYPGMVLLAATGIDALLRLIPGRGAPDGHSRRNITTSAVLVALTGLGVAGTREFHRLSYETIFGARGGIYLRLGELLRTRCNPGDRILVGEVGAIAYAMPNQYILDSSGINSPAVLRARLRDQERAGPNGPREPAKRETPEWVVEIIQEFEPRYIVTYRSWLHIQSLIRDPRVANRYQRLNIEGLDSYFVLERKGPAGNLSN